MKPILRPLLTAAAILGGALNLLAAGNGAQFSQRDISWNLQSVRGVPISSTANTNGSDGRMPVNGSLNASGTHDYSTTNQFMGLTPFGGTVGLTSGDMSRVAGSKILTNATEVFDATTAMQMRRPYGLDNTGSGTNNVVIIQRQVIIGMPYLSQQISYLFGSVITPPATDENGQPLTNTTPELYWLPEPYTADNHASDPYYWSPNAQQVFAVQAGPVAMTWKKTVPYSSTAALPSYTNINGPASFQTNGGSIYLLYTVQLTISSSAVKTPRTMYWTEKNFRNIGKPIAVPTARVGGVNVVYNSSFPKTVDAEYTDSSSTSPTDGTTNATLPELRTLWYDQSQGNIYAYNQEGRVFVELLGDANSDGVTRQFLGFEIVDVFKQAIPADVSADLGERLYPPTASQVTNLYPSPLYQASGPTFAISHNVNGSDAIELYAIHQTANLNDYLVYWMEDGMMGLQWPSVLTRYHLDWPTDVTKYSHYLRPAASSDAEAQLTAISLSANNAPTIEYQDPMDRPRAKLTADLKFYTWLDADHPAHRTLLGFSSGDYIAFERVFSWLDTGLKTPATLVGSVAENLDAWNPTNSTLNWPTGSDLTRPRVISQTVNVGDRINPPDGEAGSSGDYLAGHINPTAGTLYNPLAYLDPLTNGFSSANQSAIIPVNAMPTNKSLEVWWFRSNSDSAGWNAGDTTHGFSTIYWPSVIGRYTIQWPTNPGEIVLASKLGSGTLDAYQSTGAIYSQNDPTAPGYNPNEEHAIMSGGAAYATRDDLNLTNATNFSSMPCVLVSYTAQDGRPAMAAFNVLREKPSAGYVFDYMIPAGQLLQPPPPLTFLAKPVQGSGDSAVNFNTEPDQQSGDLPGNWNATRDGAGLFAHYKRFTYRDRHDDFWVYRGLHSGPPVLQIGTFTGATFAPPASATAIVNVPFSYTVHASRQAEYLAMTNLNALPSWLSINGLVLTGTPGPGSAGTVSLQLSAQDQYLLDSVTATLSITVAASGSVVAQGPILISSTNSATGSIIVFSNRAPFLAVSPSPTNSFTMRYYYKTQPDFDWPGVANPPPTGSIVPYLRRWDGTNHVFAGGDGASTNTTPLDIVYRPYWPVRDPSDASQPVPAMPYGYTLTEPALNLPGVRDMETARVLYQQSIASNIVAANPSVVLHDPTRLKLADLSSNGLTALPSGVVATPYQGLYYFQNLPPHLVNRVYYDPNRGANGSLVLIGQLVNGGTAGNYLLLNVLRADDLNAVINLCPSSDAVNFPSWTQLVQSLATPVEIWHENPAVPGTYIADDTKTTNVGVSDLAEIVSDNTPVDSYALSATGPGSGYVTLLESDGDAFTKTGDPVAVHIFRVGGSLYNGNLVPILSDNPLSEEVSFQHTADLAGRTEQFKYEWKIGAPVNGNPPATNNYLALTNGINVPRYTIGGAGVQALGDNYVMLRYQPVNTNHPLYGQWSDWTAPALAEGWIKRVLAGINPFNQRTTDLFNNEAVTDASILTQSGHRWEGDVALNSSTLNNYGLIEIYETVLRRGRAMSIESGYNYGPANDALLLAAGYLNDLYMNEGNEAWADAANPTIGFGTADKTYGSIATALFSFQGQVPSLLEEELALLRGRDDTQQPGVQVAPVYNRLFWNYTRGIDAGEVVYALNYNIQADPSRDANGMVSAADAEYMYPQGHGDAYGHYLTALTEYYSLLINPYFDWVPSAEAVNVLGTPVTVNYYNERKFAAAAAALARAGQQVFDLTWRRDYTLVASNGWDSLGAILTNSTAGTARYWGMDHWATRTGEGTYLNWIVGNAILPDVDTDPTHQGVQIVDRTTVPELEELTTLAASIQTDLDNAEAGLSPLGLPRDAIAFDLDPNVVVGSSNGTHFEQIYSRALVALNNAVVAFDDAKDVTALMRSEEDSLNTYQETVNAQYRAYTNSLIEIYGTPYTDDIGPGGTYKQGYAGPDFIHYTYVDVPEYHFPEMWNYTEANTFEISLADLPTNWSFISPTDLNFIQNGTNTITFNINSSGYTEKPSTWTGKRVSPGKIQQSISQYIASVTKLRSALSDATGARSDLDKAITLFNAKVAIHNQEVAYQTAEATANQALATAQFAQDLLDKSMDISEKVAGLYEDSLKDALPTVLIAGLAAGGDMTFGARCAIQGAKAASVSAMEATRYAADYAVSALAFSTDTANRWMELEGVAPLEWKLEMQSDINDIGDKVSAISTTFGTINQRLRDLDDSQRALQALIAQGDRIQAEKESFSKRVAAVIQGYRTRDAAFRIFRNEKLERYKTLFDLASRYSLLAANAYDYETGLLNTAAGQQFITKIINSRALGVVSDGVPQYAGSDTGDPGLSSALAEMKADWDVLRGRLGFNNPDAYGTTCSLRTECLRILPDTNGLANWKDALQQARMDDILADSDVRNNCMQIDSGNGLPVPGIVLQFSTTIADGYNLFGQPLAAGDHAYSSSSFATKIYGVGVALIGYRGMDDPSANSSSVTSSGSTSPTDPSLSYLDPLALAATPYVYLIPVGVDSMRSPPLGDSSSIRTWQVNDIAIPMPFNIGASDFSTKSLWQSSDSLTEALFAVRKHQAFRPVSDPSCFSVSLYTSTGGLQRSQFTNNRLVGRSVWNSKWKLVIPGKTLLNDPAQGLDRFIQTVTDVKIHFVTYSYAGN